MKAASKQDDGTILNISNIGVRVIQAGGESFGSERGREAAKWEAALEELLGFGLITARGSIKAKYLNLLVKAGKSQKRYNRVVPDYTAS